MSSYQNQTSAEQTLHVEESLSVAHHVVGKDHSLASTFALAWLAMLTPFVIAPSVLANGSEDRESVSTENDSKKMSLELSVAPMDHVEYPTTRPQWVSSEPQFNDLGTDLIVVVAGPSETPEECLEELRLMRRAAINTYVLGLVTGAVNASFYSVDDATIDQQLVSRSYVGEVTAGGESKYEHAIELQFTPAEKAVIHEAWKSVELGQRLGAVGVLLGSGLAMLICSGGVLGIFSRRIARREQAEAVHV